jgi:hypothetical protein
MNTRFARYNGIQHNASHNAGLAVGMTGILPHILCCLLPTVAALLALGTTTGLGAALAVNPLYMLVDRYHAWLLVFAVAATAISGLISWLAYKKDCRSHAGCTHTDCRPKKSAAFKIFFISCALLVVDVGYYFTEEHILGLHNHGSQTEQEAQTHAH